MDLGDIREPLGKQNRAPFNLEIFKESVLTGMFGKYQSTVDIC